MDAEAARAGGTIYVLLPVHNRRSITLEFLDQLQRQTDTRYHLVVVDDGSTDGTAEAVRSSFPEATILSGPGTWWWAGCLQHGLDWVDRLPPVSGDVVVMINDDITIDPGFLAAGRAALETRPESILLAQQHSLKTGGLYEVGVSVDWRNLKFRPTVDPESIDCFSTRGLFLRRDDLRLIGGFRPRLLPHYLSDYEFTIRAHRKGLTLATDPTVRLVMNEATTGIRRIDAKSVREYLRQSFTPRAAMNPVRWTAFLVMACPPRYVPVNVTRIWRWFAGGLVRVALGRPGQAPAATTGSEAPTNSRN